MTGQVKEDILVRIGELGIDVREGILHFDPFLLKQQEFTRTEQMVELTSLNKEKYELTIPENSVLFTCCQVPVIYTKAETNFVEVTMTDGSTRTFDQPQLDAELTQEVFQRSGTIRQINVSLNTKKLR
jgi:hypothetical protein